MYVCVCVGVCACGCMCVFTCVCECVCASCAFAGIIYASMHLYQCELGFEFVLKDASEQGGVHLV